MSRTTSTLALFGLGLGACFEPAADTSSEAITLDLPACIEVGGLVGDFELIAPPGGDILMVSNVGNAYETPAFSDNDDVDDYEWHGLKPLRLSHLSRFDGHLLGADRIAVDYAGNGKVNGPEFADLGTVAGSPVGIGVLYSGMDGIRGLWRPVASVDWDDFSVGIDGTPAPAGTGVLLPSSIHGGVQLPPPAITGAVPLGLSSYASFVGNNGECHGGMCYGDMRGGPLVDIRDAAANEGIDLSDSTTHPTLEGHVIVQGCAGGGQPTCGVYETVLDGAGLHAMPDAAPGSPSFSLIGAVSGANVGHETLRLGVVPRSGGTLVAMAYDEQADYIHVWKRVASTVTQSGWEWQLVEDIDTAGIVPEHFRTIANDDHLLLDFQVRSAAREGSYAITVSGDGSPGGVSASGWKQYSRSSYSEELLWMADAPLHGRWAAFVGDGQSILRCWVDPVTP